jgi:spermidine synthase
VAYILLALLSGIPALVYEVTWTRLVGLLIGSQIGAISAILAIYFGGLALGARVIGGASDRSPAPLRLYGALECAAGLLALLSPFALAAIGSESAAGRPEALRLALAGAAIFPVTFLLGGTLPALLRGAARDRARAAATAGLLLGANTAGAVLGVIAAAWLVPDLGLRATTLAAGGMSIVVGLSALAMARGIPPHPGEPTLHPAPPLLSGARDLRPLPALLAAFAGGAATLAFEVLAARTAALLVGSTLYAWAFVLALFLAGLASGTAAFAGRASRAPVPARDLGTIEAAAAIVLAASLAVLLPDPASPAAGLAAPVLLRLAACLFPPAFLMGAAFPYFVRLGVPGSARLGGAFGAVSAANTAGGIAGAVLAPLVLIPLLGLRGGLLACAALNAIIGVAFLARGTAPPLALARVAAVCALLALAAWPAYRPQPRTTAARLLHLAEGRQATAAVVRASGSRHLFVDGEAEASTGGDARTTEELLALLPLALHPGPRTLLEVGFGSGITLGTASLFPLDRIECVEIAGSVLESARFFEPDNRGIASGRDPRIHVVLGDGRAALAARRGRYDVIVANTVQPWSIGATGLYSREYFGRMRRALRPDGIAAQWVPVAGLDDERFAAILRTFFAAFPEGGVWWGANNVLAVGAAEPLRAGLPAYRAGFARAPDAYLAAGMRSGADLAARFLASSRTVREILRPGPILSDDRPALEAMLARRRPAAGDPGAIETLERIALASNATPGEAGGARGESPAALWVRARAARARGEIAGAATLEERAIREGFEPGRRERAARFVAEGLRALAARRFEAAAGAFERALSESPEDASARFGVAVARLRQRDPPAARRELDRLVRDHPDHAEGWNLLGVLRLRAGDRGGAREAFDLALTADPYYPEALANAALAAAAEGDTPTARRMLARLRAISPGGPTPEERAVLHALGERDAR